MVPSQQLESTPPPSTDTQCTRELPIGDTYDCLTAISKLRLVERTMVAAAVTLITTTFWDRTQRGRRSDPAAYRASTASTIRREW
jgi:hypothetical protein